MKYDFTSILNRDGMDAIAVNPPMNASWISFAPIKEGFDLADKDDAAIKIVFRP